MIADNRGERAWTANLADATDDLERLRAKLAAMDDALDSDDWDTMNAVDWDEYLATERAITALEDEAEYLEERIG